MRPKLCPFDKQQIQFPQALAGVFLPLCTEGRIDSGEECLADSIAENAAIDAEIERAAEHIGRFRAVSFHLYVFPA